MSKTLDKESIGIGDSVRLIRGSYLVPIGLGDPRFIELGSIGTYQGCVNYMPSEGEKDPSDESRGLLWRIKFQLSPKSSFILSVSESDLERI